eukprot:31019_1
MRLNPQYSDIIIFNRPRCTLSDLIEFIEKYGNRQYFFTIHRFIKEWHNFKISHVLAMYMQLYLRHKIGRHFKYDDHIDLYYTQIPTVSDIQQHYRPYLDHIASQIDPSTSKSKGIIQDFHIYMNAPMPHGPILALSMHKRDLLVFGYIHKFKRKRRFHSRIIPWDVIKLIHAFYHTINKLYLDKYAGIQRNIIEIESEIGYLKLHTTTKDRYIMNAIHQKQSKLLTLYNMTNDIRFQEEYEPHFIDKYIINTKQYQLSGKEYADKIRTMPFTLFESVYDNHPGNLNLLHAVEIAMKSFLFALLKRIVPKHLSGILETHKKVIQEQINIYADYCRLKVGYTQYNKAQLYDHMPRWISEIFCKENAWTLQISKASIYRGKSSKYHKSAARKSFTVD